MRQRGFSMIELMVAMAILATILSLAVPRYFNNLDTAREAVLRQDLYILRDAIDKFYSDTGKYPEVLNDLVKRRYMRALPVDPYTRSSLTWVVEPPADASMGAVFDVRSAAPNKARDGTWFKDW